MVKILKTILEQFKIVILIYVIIGFGQAIATKTSVENLFLGSVVSFVLVMLAIIIKNFVKRPNLPGFAWATLVAFFLTLPISPFGELISHTVGKLDFTSTGTPLLAFAGISIGDKLNIFRDLSWKLIIISFIVMSSTYFGSSLISQAVLKANGLI